MLTGYSAWQILCKMRVNKYQTKVRTVQSGQLPINYCPGNAAIPDTNAQLSAFRSTRIYLGEFKICLVEQVPHSAFTSLQTPHRGQNPAGAWLYWECKSQQATQQLSL